MCRAIGRLDLGDAILERLIVGARLGELVVHLQRQLHVTLLEVQLRHRLVYEGLRAGAGEHFVIFSRSGALVYVCSGRWRPCVQRILVVGSRARRASERLRGCVTRQTLGPDRLGGQFGLGSEETLGAHQLVLPSSAQTLGTNAVVRQSRFDWIGRSVSLKSDGGHRVCRFRRDKCRRAGFDGFWLGCGLG
jgi:hypothetical protein